MSRIIMRALLYRGWSICNLMHTHFRYAISQEEAEGITFPDAREQTSTVIDKEDSYFNSFSVIHFYV